MVLNIEMDVSNIETGENLIIKFVSINLKGVFKEYDK